MNHNFSNREDMDGRDTSSLSLLISMSNKNPSQTEMEYSNVTRTRAEHPVIESGRSFLERGLLFSGRIDSRLD